MASGRIKGITIQIDGSTKGLDKALQGVNKRSIDLQKELKDVERLLKFDPGNVEALAQKQRLLTQQIENTADKLDQLKNAQSQVEAQFKNGDIGESQYMAFRREIEFTEGSLNKLKQAISQVDDGSSLSGVKQDLSKVSKEAEDAEDAIGELGGELKNVVAGALAGGGIAAVVEKALDTSSLNTKIDISMNVPESSMASVKDAINTVESYGVDAEAALEGVRRQWSLNKNASDETNAAVVNGAATIVATYAGIDFTELIQETNEISKSLGISNEEALGLTNSLLKAGFPPEQLDIISEYGTQLQMAGYSAEEIQAIFAAGVDTGTWNIDNLLDGIKEGRIKVAEFGQEVPKAMQELLSGTDISAKQMQEWGNAVAKGGEGGSKAMQEIAKELQGIDDETKKNALGVQIFGTIYEDQGQNIIDTLLNAKGATVNLKDGQDQLNDATSKLNADPAIKMKQAISDLNVALGPLLSVVADFVAGIAQWISNNPQLAATIAAVVTALGILMGIMAFLSPIITTLIAATTTFSIGIGAIAAPILIAIGIITALIAIGVALYANWDTIKAKAIEIWHNVANTIGSLVNSIKTKFQEMKNAVSTKMSEVKTTISDLWNQAKSFLQNIDLNSIGKNIIEGLVNGIKSMIGSVRSVVSDIASTIKNKITDALDIHSPSRVMMEIGEYTGEGLALGIESTIGAISKQSQAMADAINPNVSNVIPTTSIGSNAYTGSSGETLEGAIRKILSETQIVVPINIDGREIAIATAPYMETELNMRNKRVGRLGGVL
jgi:phage-related minor tail protein